MFGSNSATSARRDGRRARHTREIYERMCEVRAPLYTLNIERYYAARNEVTQRSNSEMWPSTGRPLAERSEVHSASDHTERIIRKAYIVYCITLRVMPSSCLLLEKLTAHLLSFSPLYY